MRASYSPGLSDNALLALRGTCAVVLESASAVRPHDLWDALAAPSPVEVVLELLTREGFAAVPPFAILHWAAAGSTRLSVLVRGTIRVALKTAADSLTLSSDGISTWHERVVDDVVSAVVGVEDQPHPSFPIENGVVWMRRVVLQLESAVSAAPSIPAMPAKRTVPIVLKASVVPKVPGLATIPATENTITQVSESTGGYGHLFGETVVRSIDAAAVRPVEPNPDGESHDPPDPEQTSAAADAGDHDGFTIMISELPSRGGTRPLPASRSSKAESTSVIYLDFSTGGSEPLVQPILVGRSPSIAKISSDEVPRLVTIPGDHDISRNHAKFVLEGDTVVVTDLHSKNGTSIVLPGRAPQLLRAGDPTPVVSGTVVDMGGGITVTVRDSK